MADSDAVVLQELDRFAAAGVVNGDRNFFGFQKSAKMLDDPFLAQVVDDISQGVAADGIDRELASHL